MLDSKVYFLLHVKHEIKRLTWAPLADGFYSAFATV